jgi:hypothetical protein
MFKLKTKPEHPGLPEPVALTPEQLNEIAATTAGGLTLSPSNLIIRSGGIPPAPYLSAAAAGAAY